MKRKAQKSVKPSKTSHKQVARRTQSEEAKESRRALSTLMSNLPGMAYRCQNGPDWTMEFVSDGSFELTGYYPCELIDNQKVSYGELIDPDDRAMVWESVQTALAEKKAYKLVYRIRSAGGNTKWVWEQGVGIFSADGRLPALEGFVTDITERKLAEERSRKYLERIHALHEIDRAISSTLDLDAVLNILLEKIEMHVVPESPSAVRLWYGDNGILEPVVCRNLDERQWKEEKRGVAGGLAKRVLETKAPVIATDARNDPIVRDPDFFKRHGLVSYLGLPLSAKGEFLGVLSFYTRERREFSDDEVEFLTTLAGQASVAINNAQLYQKTKEQAVALEKTSRVKGEFLSVMSHELRTPLNVVMGYTAMHEDGIFGAVNEEQRSALQKVLRQSKGLLVLVNGILSATQIGSGAVKKEDREVNLAELLGEIRTDYNVPLDKPLTLHWDYCAEMPIVNTDKEKLRHILQNLIENAIKFTDQGSVAISVRCDQGPVEIKVADTGIGIPEDKIPVIFELFRQLDSSETRSHGGVGVGLYVVKQFTELLGGKILVESKLGKGSTFTITIPRDNGTREDPNGPDGSSVEVERNTR